MAKRNHWLLPEGIEEVLPPQAWRLEQLRRRLFDLYRSWGYELIVPPLIEYLEPLLTGAGNDLDLQTFKLTDQLTGRLMGIRADITTQAARIDAHQLKRNGPVRLCYLGTVLRTRPDGFAGSRSPLQLGAELFGHAGIESDVEILLLMLETLAITGIEHMHLDLGHVGILRGLSREAGLDEGQEAVLFNALQRKALPEIRDIVASLAISVQQREQLASLAELHGTDEVLEQARQVLQGAGPAVQQALHNLQDIAAAVRRRRPDRELARLPALALRDGERDDPPVPRADRERLHVGLPALPGRPPPADRPGLDPLRRLLVPRRDPLPRPAPRRARRRGPDRLHRPPGGRLEGREEGDRPGRLDARAPPRDGGHGFVTGGRGAEPPAGLGDMDVAIFCDKEVA